METKHVRSNQPVTTSLQNTYIILYLTFQLPLNYYVDLTIAILTYICNSKYQLLVYTERNMGAAGGMKRKRQKRFRGDSNSRVVSSTTSTMLCGICQIACAGPPQYTNHSNSKAHIDQIKTLFGSGFDPTSVAQQIRSSEGIIQFSRSDLAQINLLYDDYEAERTGGGESESKSDSSDEGEMEMSHCDMSESDDDSKIDDCMSESEESDKSGSDDDMVIEEDDMVIVTVKTSRST